MQKLYWTLHTVHSNQSSKRTRKVVLGGRLGELIGLYFHIIVGVGVTRYSGLFMTAQPRALTGEIHSLDRELDEDEPERKKTKITKDKRASRRKLWIFTLNNHTITEARGLVSSTHIAKFVFQEEDEGTPHLQGVLRLKVKHRLLWLKNHISQRAHWEPCKDLMASIIYCSKEQKRAQDGRIWTKGWIPPTAKIAVKDPLAEKDLYAYQEEIIDIVVSEPDERAVYWYWSRKGKIGKSSLVKHLVLKYHAVAMGGKFKDALYAIAERADKNKPLKVIIFDIPRSQGNKVSYTAIESIKNGCFFSGKYESRMCTINTPHMIIFANAPPNEDLLSEDRWIIKCLDYEDDLQHI